ncbi:2OG-Fe(II) oxygenase family protein [Skeletonema marinoi]|uniref:2OG-Fe(II) oxygenase family protein n=1 Tax=Skeletonema marinoi TaxID=267567 RepID=A0AAD8XWC9_9STRA|nr:2OG-Fe(II) oxygenase family protein [Skeletonema marinoi]KAK1734899.1 2OG-Fe(II) oxygenase family protein [Skeletonema marinoi]
MTLRIIRNVGGIEGLHLATNCFTEEVERRIFTSIDESGYQSGKRTCGGQPTGLLRWPYDWPEDYNKLVNLVRDCGLLPDYVPPDYCLRLMYPPKAGFQFHHDSKYRWGEVIVGVNLGQEGEIMFTPDRPEDAFDQAAYSSEFASKSAGVGKSMRIKLPRRFIYIMSGPSRYVYKHGIAQQKPTQAPPSWNTLNMRKSLTFRCTKVFSDVFLERKLQEAAELEVNHEMRIQLQSRKEAQDKFKPNGTRAVVAQERQNATLLLNMMDSGIIPLPPARAAGHAPSVAAAAFQGEGRQLGSSINNGGVAGDDDDMQMAINASLRSLAEERAARSSKKRKRRKRGSDEGASESCEEASPKKRSGGADVEGGVIDLVGEDDDDEEEDGIVIVVSPCCGCCASRNK